MRVSQGKLFLIPTPLGDMEPQLVMPAEAIHLLHNLEHLIVENLRTARRLLSKSGIPKPIDSIQFYVLNKHSTDEEVRSFLAAAEAGQDIGLISEAGSPCVADPGAKIVSMAHHKKIKVVPLAGPSSITMALMASGFNGQSFSFHGYLPIQSDNRNKAIRELEYKATNTGETQIFIETPFRNQQLLEVLLKVCRPNTLLCLGTNISMPDEMIHTKSIHDWQKAMPNLHKKPTVFLLGREWE